MSFITRLKKIIKKDKINPLEAKIIYYVEGLINEKSLVKEIIAKFAQTQNAPTALERQKTSIQTYYALEDFVSKQRPPVVARALTWEELRSEIKQNFAISKTHLLFRPIFLSDNERLLNLFEIAIADFIRQLTTGVGVDQLKILLATAVKNTPLEEVQLTNNTVDFSLLYPKITQIKSLDLLKTLKAVYNNLYQQTNNSFGSDITNKLIEENYSIIKGLYEYRLTAEFLSFLPDGILSQEKLTYSTREELEHEAKKAIEEKTKLEELDKTKRAMLNLLEDAKSLETELKIEKESVEKKVVDRTKELHDEQIKLEASINSLSVGFIMIDNNNNIVIINQAAKMNFCASESSPLITITDCSLTHIEDELKAIIDLRSYINHCLTEKKTITIRELVFHKKFLKIIITPIIAIGVFGAVILVEDITEAKIMERSKDEFFSIASHELRTPLTAIRGNTSMIQQFYAEKIKDPEFAEMISDIHESSTRLIEIVNDFLDTSRLEMGKMEFKKEAFDVLQLAKDTIKEYMTTGSMKMLYLKVEDPAAPLPQVLADRNKVKQVLINLIGNAIKFTETGGITLKILPTEKLMKVYIIDTGKGISPTSQNLLFRKFQQAQDNLLTRDTTKGTGLGLYISKMIVEGMGGEIKIESSNLGKGTTFSVSMPIAMRTTTVQSPPLQAAPAVTIPQVQPLLTEQKLPIPIPA